MPTVLILMRTPSASFCHRYHRRYTRPLCHVITIVKHRTTRPTNRNTIRSARLARRKLAENILQGVGHLPSLASDEDLLIQVETRQAFDLL